MRADEDALGAGGGRRGEIGSRGLPAFDDPRGRVAEAVVVAGRHQRQARTGGFDERRIRRALAAVVGDRHHVRAQSRPFAPHQVAFDHLADVARE